MHVIVLAYGPAQTSKQAMRRARSLAGGSGTVIAAAANPTATDAIAKLGPGSRASGVGRSALTEALGRLPDEPTLLIHDDALITAKGVAALHEELDAGSRFVVPYTNDPETGHYPDPLPAGRDAAAYLDTVTAPDSTIALSRSRATCILARRSDLEALNTEPLADPFGIIDTTAYGFTLAGSALAAHSSECLDRMVDADHQPEPLLVAALIVKDEEEMLPDCLDSLRGLVDRIEICDTGSTDNTIAIARAAGAHVIEREWPGNFAVARNYALGESRDAIYVLTIDADERVQCPDPQALRRYLATYWTEHGSFRTRVANIEPDGSKTMEFSSVRLYRGQGHEYRGAVHEIIYPIGEDDPAAGGELSQLSFAHYGYADEIVADKDKVHRNLALARAEYAENPGPPAAVHLARSLAQASAKPEDILELLEEAWSGSAHASPAARSQILNLMAEQWIALGDDQQAYDISRQALRIVPAEDTAAATLAQTAHRLGKLQDLIEISAQLATAHSARPAQDVAANRAIFRSALTAAHAQAGNAEQAVTEAFGVLTDYPENFGAWSPLVGVLMASYGDAALEIIVPLAVKDPIGMFLDPMVRVVPSKALAQFCLAYREAGGTLAEATRVGLLAAALSGRDDTFAALAPHAAQLDANEIERLVDRISASGRTDLAALLPIPQTVGV